MNSKRNVQPIKINKCLYNIKKKISTFNLKQKVNFFLSLKKKKFKKKISRLFVLKSQVPMIKRKLHRQRQVWRWRWNRKGDSAWKRIRFINPSSLRMRPYRVHKSHAQEKLLLDFLKWKFSLTAKILSAMQKRSLLQNNTQRSANYLLNLLALRWDNILCFLRVTRNISNSRELIKSGRIFINGRPLKDLNQSILVGDTFFIQKVYVKTRTLKIMYRYDFIEYNRYARTGIFVRNPDMLSLSNIKPQLMRRLSTIVLENIIPKYM